MPPSANRTYARMFALKRSAIHRRRISGSAGSGSSVHGCTLHTDQGQGRFPVVPVGGAVVCDLFSSPCHTRAASSGGATLKQLTSGLPLTIEMQPCHLCRSCATRTRTLLLYEALQQLHMGWACWRVGGVGGEGGTFGAPNAPSGT